MKTQLSKRLLILLVIFFGIIFQNSLYASANQPALKLKKSGYTYRGDKRIIYAIEMTPQITTLDHHFSWYVVNKNVTVKSQIKITGTINLILEDGCTLTAANGISVSGNSKLTIWGQDKGTGKLIANGGSYRAGLEVTKGNGLVINGGTIQAKGRRESDGYNEHGGAGIGGGDGQAAGLIIINAGKVDAKGDGGGAGIGNGFGATGGEVTINGGNVKAAGGGGGAGIGGGRFLYGGTTININGGTIEAQGNSGGAGIGGGLRGNSGTITISGGTITASGGESQYGGGAGIGCGAFGGAANKLTITGGMITATGGKNGGAGIGGSGGGSGRLYNFSITGGWILATGQKNYSGGNANAIGGGANFSPASLSAVKGAVIIDGATKKGEVYGTHVLSGNREISNGYTLTIPLGAKLDTKNYTLTNKGTILSAIRFHANGGAFSDGKKEFDTIYKYSSSVTTFDSLKVKAPERQGCRFVGWYENTDGTGSETKQLAANTFNSKEYYAKWELPVTITKQPEAKQVVYGYTGQTLSIEVQTAQFSKSTQTAYQWYQTDADKSGQNKLIDGATESSYNIPQGLGVGTYTYYCTITNNGYSVDSNKVEFKVTQSATSYQDGVKTYGSGEDTQTKESFILGDPIIIKVTPVTTGAPVSGEKAVKGSEPSENQIAIYNQQDQLTEARDVTSGTAMTFEISSLEAGLKPNEDGSSQQYTLTAAYAGSDNMEAHSESTNITVAWLESAPDAILSGEEGDDGWYVNNVTLEAPENYTINLDCGTTWNSNAVITEDTNGEVVYYLKNQSGQIARKTVNIKLDKTPPVISESVSEITLHTGVIRVNAQDQFSGIASYTLKKESGEGEPQIENKDNGVFDVSLLRAAQTYTFSVTVKDKAGNETTDIIQFNTPVRSLADATVTMDSTQEYIYDGNEKTPKIEVKFDNGVIARPDQYTLVYENSNGGKGNHTNAGTVELTVEAVEGGRYYDSVKQKLTFEIRKKELTVESVVLQDRAFDGTYLAVLSDVILNGVVGKDDVYADIADIDGVLPDKNAGRYDNVTIPEFTIAGKDANNYVLLKSAGKVAVSGGMEITKADGEAEVSMENWIYSPDNSTAKSPVPVSATNGDNNVTYAYKVKGQDDSTYTAALPRQAGSYTLLATFAETQNYKAVVARTDFTIGKAQKPAVMPDTKMTAPENAIDLRDIPLPEGWSWKDADKELESGNTITVSAIYKDQKNYEQTEVEIEVSKAGAAVKPKDDTEEEKQNITENTSEDKADTEKNVTTEDITQSEMHKDTESEKTTEVSKEAEKSRQKDIQKDVDEKIEPEEGEQEKRQNTTTEQEEIRKEKQGEAQKVTEGKAEQSETQKATDEKEKRSETQKVTDEKEKQSETQKVTDEKEKQSETRKVTEGKEKQDETQRIAERKEEQTEIVNEEEKEEGKEEAKNNTEEMSQTTATEEAQKTTEIQTQNSLSSTSHLHIALYLVIVLLGGICVELLYLLNKK